ncbi:MAG TPA: bifunctional [glutamate--ammonia ligase]-adenylyl-L-tyrosine phosphorylase/[glutamate--ammonia-ligase] adenylyltransferase [Acetobacteraceae bacterium]|nr:bifunctional [glutamate--ammonia ligase]-adenylyl-L-tyrosine phosphorylase/[glutamate--ammonia-ligase] adenylyltransferase [Acetobacteraceae bacterium]
MAAPFHLASTWPAPHDPAAAERLVERFSECGRAEARLAGRPAVRALLAALGGNSPYLSDLAVREAAALRDLAARGPQPVVDDALAALRAVPPGSPRAPVAAALRRAKRVVGLATAVADLGGIWRLERVTAALSDLAEAALTLAAAHLLRGAHAAGDLLLPDPDNPGRGGGFTVLGMGKLGARELNYSSDVDLVLLYDPLAPIYTERTEGDATASFAARFARGLVSLMEARDADGYVFRTDLRLRPDPAATPPAVAVTAAITYYESMGQNWERAAMIKARPVAGDLALGAAFLEAIRPFVWRRGLDFSAVADIHAMKQRINAHARKPLPPGGRGRRDAPAEGAAAPPGQAAMRSGTASARSAAASPPALSRLDLSRSAGEVLGHNVKLGEGGIREIEFLVQTLQLVWGGRDPELRAPATLVALRLLVRAGHIPRRAAAELAAAYRFLRLVEHRLQMVADRQVHALPERPAELEAFATFMGFSTAAAFAAALLDRLARVRARYAEVFEQVPQLLEGEAAAGPSLDFSGDGVPEETLAALQGLGFAEPARIVDAVRRWQAGHVRAFRSQRARELMDLMLPALLAALGRQPHPDATFARFDAFIARQPAGVQLLSLFQRNPSLLERVAAVLGAAPPLADYLAQHPAALEGLLSPQDDDPPVRLLRSRLRDARLLEDVIGIIRRTVKEVDFSLSVATMEGRLDADAAGERRSALADAALAALLPPVLADFSVRFGSVRGGAMVAVLLGKAGGREMMAGSDLDLMLIYAHPQDETESRGARSLPASQWFIRAAHSFVAAVTAPGADGQLYAVDMRLRPSGNKGPVAVSLASFRRYHAEDAWTWERMALTRARVVAGPPPLRARVEEAIAETIAEAGEPVRIRADAAAMRARMRRELPPDGVWDVKQRPGGLVDIEFIAQTLQLMVARENPAVCSPNTCEALDRLAAAGKLDAADAALLVRADRVWRTVQGMLRITVGRAIPGELPEASVRPLLRAVAALGLAADDVPGLRVTLDALAAEVSAVFERIVGKTAGAQRRE